MLFRTANNAKSRIAEELEVSSTVLTFTAGTGSRFPETDDDYFVLTVSDSTGLITEIMHVTERVGDVCTVVRAQEGTTALAWPELSAAENLWTKGQVEALVQQQQAQFQTYNYAVATSPAANEYVAEYVPGLAEPIPGMPVSFKVPAGNDGPAEFKGWESASVPIRRRDGSELVGGELITGAIAELKWNGSLLLLQGLMPAPESVDVDDNESVVTPRYLGFALENFAAIGANCAIAFYSDGTYKQTLPIVSQQAYRIKSVHDAGGLTAIRLWNKPKVIPTELTCRPDCAINGLTYGAHQIDGTWDVEPGADPFTFVLQGCPWVEDGVFVIGHCYAVGSEKPESSAELNRLLQYGGTTGGNTLLITPPGAMYQKNEVVRMCGSTTWRGAGSASSFMFLADKADQPGVTPDGRNGLAHMLGTGFTSGTSYPNVVGINISGISLHGNRTRQTYQAGMHAVDLGGDSDPLSPLQHVLFIDFWINGSGGYGSSLGGHNIKQYVIWLNGGIQGCDGDAEDYKNRESENISVTNENMTFKYWALGSQGTNLSYANPYGAVPIYFCAIIEANPLTTYSGESYATISQDVTTAVPWKPSGEQIQEPLVNARPGERVSFLNTTSFAGVDFNRTFNIIDYDDLGNIVIDLEDQVANASLSGGGSAVTLFCANLSVGDRIVDMRGKQFSSRGCNSEAWFYGRSGWNQRFGSNANNAQEGGVYAIVDGCSGIDTSPLWIKDIPYLSGKGRGFLNLGGRGARATNNTFTTRIGGVGIDLGTTSVNAFLSGNTMIGCDIGCRNRGRHNTQIGTKVINPVVKGFGDNGSNITYIIPMDDDPATPEELGGIGVIFTCPNPHGRTVGQRVRFSGFENTGNGIYIRPSNVGESYQLLAIPSPTTFLIDADGSSGATSMEPFGGNSVDARFAGDDQSTYRNTYIDCEVIFEDDIEPDELFEYAFDVGSSEGDTTGLSTEARFFNCIVSTLVPAAKAYRDLGNDTVWQGNTSPLPSVVTADIVEAPYVLTRRALGPLLTPGGVPLVVTAPTNRVTVNRLGYFSTLFVSAFGLTHDSLSNQNWGIELSRDGGKTFLDTGYVRLQASGGSSKFIFCGSVAGSAQVGFDMVAFNFNSPSSMLYCKLKGGAKDTSTSSLSGPGYYPGTYGFNAIGIVASGGAMITGGTLLVQGTTLGEV